ncbi:MAG: histidine phosphatase family protein [bacterium]
MDIYLIRHGESTGNNQHRFMGWSDYPLSPAGELQTEVVADRLAKLGPMPVISSDLLRARQTAMAIAGKWGGEISTDSRWRETNFGALDDRSWDDLTNNAELSALMDNDPVNTPWPQGESAATMANRVNEAFLELCGSTDESIAVVTHGGPIHAVVAHCLQIPPEKYWTLSFSHAGITHIQIVDGWTSIITVNDAGQL